MMDVVKAICGLILICFGVWLFIKLIFHPILFELDLQNKGKKGISFIMTGIQIAGIIAMYICYGEHDQGAIDACILSNHHSCNTFACCVCIGKDRKSS